MTQVSMDSIVAQVEDMDVLPTVVTEIMHLSRDPNSTIHDMEKVILTDQALTTRVLRLANSAYYGYARRISTISQATILLGFDTIRSMAIASTVSTFMADELKGYALDANDLWIQSQTCAIISRHIAKVTGKHDPEEAYVAGLLRDIGKTILNQYMIDDYKEVLDIITNDRRSFSDAETMVFGFNHAEIGAKVAEKWNLPSNLVEAIKNHHHPERSEVEDADKILLSIIHIADAMTMIMGIGIGIDGLSYSMSSESLDILEIDVEQFKEIISDAADLIKDQDSFFLDN